MTARIIAIVLLAMPGLCSGLMGCVIPEFQAPISDPNILARVSGEVVRVEVLLPSESLMDRISVGSGFLISPNTGVTCAHVVSGRKEGVPVQAEIGGKRYELEIVGENEVLDIAVFTFSPQISSDLTSRISEQPPGVGQTIYVVGYSIPGVILGGPATVTGGIVSGMNRSILYERERIDGLIQLDAVSSDGNSGGPVVTRDGRIAGMVVFAASGESAEWRGATFAMPIQVVMRAAREIMHNSAQGAQTKSSEKSEASSVKDLIAK